MNLLLLWEERSLRLVKLGMVHLLLELVLQVVLNHCQFRQQAEGDDLFGSHVFQMYTEHVCERERVSDRGEGGDGAFLAHRVWGCHYGQSIGWNSGGQPKKKKSILEEE